MLRVYCICVFWVDAAIWWCWAEQPSYIVLRATAAAWFDIGSACILWYSGLLNVYVGMEWRCIIHQTTRRPNILFQIFSSFSRGFTLNWATHCLCRLILFLLYVRDQNRHHHAIESRNIMWSSRDYSYLFGKLVKFEPKKKKWLSFICFVFKKCFVLVVFIFYVNSECI